MTIETIGTIEPKDISAIEFECITCGAKTIRRLDKTLRVPMDCGNCMEHWFVNQNNPEYQDIQYLMEKLKSFSREGFPYILRFQVIGLGDRR